MNWNAPNAMMARLKHPSGPPNSVNAKGRTEGKLQMLLSPRKNGLTALFKEVRVFKVPDPQTTWDKRKRFRDRQRGGGKKEGGGRTSWGDPPWKTVSDPPHLGTFCPPYSISLSKSLRNAQNFPQLTSSETIFGGSRKMVSDRPSSRGFAFRYVLPPPFSSAQKNVQKRRKIREENEARKSKKARKAGSRLGLPAIKTPIKPLGEIRLHLAI